MTEKDLAKYKRRYRAFRHHAWAGLGFLSVLGVIRLVLAENSPSILDFIIFLLIILLIIYIVIALFFTYKYRAGLSAEEVVQVQPSVEVEKAKVEAEVEKERLKVEKKKAKAESKKAKKTKK